MTTYTDTQIADELAAWLERDRAGAMPVAGVADDDENADIYDLVECLIAQRAPAPVEGSDDDPDRTTDLAGNRL
jgi:hypothetical protein